MEMKDVYLFELYKRLGIQSTYVPDFRDGNYKYVSNVTKGQSVVNVTGGKVG